MLTFFWWYKNLFPFICFKPFFLSFFYCFFSFTCWSYFINCFISNEIFYCFFCFWTTLLEAVFAASIHFFVAVSTNFLPVYHHVLLKKTKNDILKHIFFFWVELNISFILTCSNYKKYIHIIFYFKWSIILICKLYFDGLKFCINGFLHWL